MSELSDESKRVLRRQVLDLRSDYRLARDKWIEAQQRLAETHLICQRIRTQIQSLQMDCGDPTEIDPHHPEDDRYFEPLRGIPCADGTCVLYRCMDGGCRVCGVPAR